MPTIDDSAVGSSPAAARNRPSIYDVAARAGVSHMTVSRVLNDHPNIRESTRAKVLAAISEMNYTRSMVARALATKRAMRIGVLVDAPVEYGPSSTLRAIERAAREEDYAVSSFSTIDTGDTSFNGGILDLVTQGVDALCVVAPRSDSLDVLREHPTGLPTLVVKAEPDETLLTAAVDQHAGAALAVNHLIELGHSRILHMSGPLDWLDAVAREQTWRETISAAGLPVLPIIEGDWSSDAGYQAGRHHPAFDSVTAVFASNDQMALGLIHGLSKRGLRVPQDISIVGFDDLPDARHFLPPLTTIRQDFEALGTVSMKLLFASLDGDTTPQSAMIAPELVVRESAAAPAA